MKALFNLYLDDLMKQKAIDKLCRLNGELPKGQLASLIRVMLKDFIDKPDDQCVEIARTVMEEYEYTSKKNKRSNL